jgi:hypothetical protein
MTDDDEIDEPVRMTTGHAETTDDEHSDGAHKRGLYVPDLSVEPRWTWHVVPRGEIGRERRRIGFGRE